MRHPFLNSWWLLDVKALRHMLTEDNDVILDGSGKAPPASSCFICADGLYRVRGQMPARALADHNWMGMQPAAFQQAGGSPLSDATLLPLARARAVVIKEVAERAGKPRIQSNNRFSGLILSHFHRLIATSWPQRFFQLRSMCCGLSCKTISRSSFAERTLKRRPAFRSCT